MLYPSLLTVHILSGIFWGGGAILGGFGIGFQVQKPMAERMTAIAVEVKAGGGRPTEGQKADMIACQARMAKGARVGAWQLPAAAVLMSVHSLVAQALR